MKAETIRFKFQEDPELNGTRAATAWQSRMETLHDQHRGRPKAVAYSAVVQTYHGNG